MTTLETRLNEVARIAVRLEAETGCPAQLLIAQWALESKWGEEPVGAANYFGIKKAARHQRCCTVTTTEYVNHKPVTLNLEFADYYSLEESCHDYAWLITNATPYQTAWQQYQQNRDLHALIAAVAHTYATDPGYAHLVAVISDQTNVTRAVASARQEVPNAAA